MKKFLIPVITLILMILIVFLGFNWWVTNSRALSSTQSPIRFVIPKGRSATQIGDSLVEKGLIKSPLAFKVYVQVTGKAEKIQAGEFTLSPHLSLVEIVERLGSGPEELWVTIPEGLRREEIPERFIESLELNSTQASVFRQVFLEESRGKEGFLFPDTYLFPRDVEASVVVDKLSKTHGTRIEELEKDIFANSYTLDQLITLASLIERETKTEEERPVVAGILFNRLEIGMALQVDATVQYAVANENCLTEQLDKILAEDCEWWPVLTRQNLEINSPYNSYRFTGLPPTPIANPGISSIRAAINPQDTNYLFYIHDLEGIIHYAETLAGHNQNIRQYLGK